MREESRRIRNNRIRRARQLRHRLMAGGLALCLSITLSIFACSFFSRAESADHTVYYKYFTSIMITPGDTLYSIASLYADDHYESPEAYAAEVSAINHLQSPDEIRAGEYLVVPYYSTEFH